MKIYELDADSTGEWARYSTLHGQTIGIFDATTPFEVPRQPIPIARSASLDGGTEKLPDFTCVNNTPIPCFGQRAKQALGPAIDSMGKWFALDCEEAPFWLFEIENVVDALDVDRSKILYFTGGGRVMRIAEFSFTAEILRGQLMFKIPQRSYNLVTDAFVDLVSEHRLTGFVFTLLWTSEDGPVSSSLKDYEKTRITGLDDR